MKKRHKIILCIIVLLLIVNLFIGLSYAYYIFSVSQSSSNIVRTNCFEITYSDGDAISLGEAIPLTDSEASELEPYTFTIKNICNNVVDYDINLEILEGSTMDLDAVALELDDNSKQILGELNNNEVIVNSSASSSKNVFSGVLRKGTSKTHNLKLWIDDSATLEQSMSKKIMTKVVVDAKLNLNYSEGTLKTGETVNKALKRLSGDSSPNSSTSNTSIKKIELASVMPNNLDNYTDISIASSKYPIYAWFDTDTIYIYTENDVILLNPDSKYLFSYLDGLENVDLTMFDTSIVENMNYMFYHCGLTSADFSKFDTSSVTTMAFMFNYSRFTSLDLSNFNTSNVVSMSRMFYSSTSLTEINMSSFDTSNVKSMAWMFDHVTSLESIDVSNFDTSNVTDMTRMFNSLSSVRVLDISNFNTSNVTGMSQMFASDTALRTIYVGSGWDTSLCSSSTTAFFYNSRLVGGAGTTYSSSKTTLEYARVDDPDNGKPGYFTLKTN